MDNLEKMLKDNKELFMDQDPPGGHFERFEKRLARQNRRKNTLRLTYRISRVAAVGLLMIMSSLWAYNELIRPEDKVMTLGDVSNEYRDVEFFFTNQISSKYEELHQINLQEDPSFMESMLIEIDQMDSVYTQLQEELGANPGDERIAEAMIRHYQTKLKVMTEILNHLKSFQESNNSQKNNPIHYESVEL